MQRKLKEKGRSFFQRGNFFFFEPTSKKDTSLYGKCKMHQRDEEANAGNTAGPQSTSGSSRVEGGTVAAAVALISSVDDCLLKQDWANLCMGIYARIFFSNYCCSSRR